MIFGGGPAAGEAGQKTSPAGEKSPVPLFTRPPLPVIIYKLKAGLCSGGGAGGREGSDDEAIHQIIPRLSSLDPGLPRTPRNLLTTVLFLCAACIISGELLRHTGGENNSDLVFILAIMCISLLTDGYFYGIAASVVGALCINPPGCKDITADKMLTFQVVSRVVPAGMIPRTMLVTGDVDPKVVGDYVGYPVVLKVLHGEGGKGVILVRDEAELKNILKLLSASPMTDQVIAQQAIMSSKGRDLRIVVINGKAVDAIVRCNPGSFTSNVHQGGHVEFCDPPEQLKEIAVRVADAIGILFGSVDFLFGEKEGEFYICESNS